MAISRWRGFLGIYAPVPWCDGRSPRHAVACPLDPAHILTDEKQRHRLTDEVSYDLVDTRSSGLHGWPKISRSVLQLKVFLLLGGIVALFLVHLVFAARQFEWGTTRSSLVPHCKDSPTAVGVVSPTQSSIPSSSVVLEVFQVYQPVLTPAGLVDETTTSDGSSNTSPIGSAESMSSCNQILMEHSFGFSYGHPFVGQYTPPSCMFNRVVMNFTVTSRGRQFDRLALMYFGDTEVWRTSTAEPTADGIIWTYMKDMSEYLYFWNEPQKLIFDLGNLVDDTYTGFFNTTLTATFFMGQDDFDPAEVIIPISARNSASNAASVFMLPANPAINTINFPQNVNRAIFSVSACGQADEEFWWSNVLQSDVDTFLPSVGTLPGFSPWREVQVYIDGELAGVQWPFPVIFTGGVAPGLWRPIVGIDAFDLREHEIDITPWLPVLCDGATHTFEIKVAGISDDGGFTGRVVQTVGNSWYVTGKIFLWLDSPSSVTTGTAPVSIQPLPAIALTQSYMQNGAGANETLTYSTIVSRSLSVSSLVKSEKGTTPAGWSQALSYSNYGSFSNQGRTQVNTLSTSGLDTSAGLYPYRSSYSSPLFANTTVQADASGNFSISAILSHGMSVEVSGKSIFPSGVETFSAHPGAKSMIPSFSGSYLNTIQNGSAYYFSSPSTKTGISFGSTAQEFSFGGTNTGGSAELYNRDVAAANGSIVRDREVWLDTPVRAYTGPAPPQQSMGMEGTVDSPKAALGRGPGQSRPVLVQVVEQKA